MNNELKRMQKEVVIAYNEVLQEYLLGAKPQVTSVRTAGLQLCCAFQSTVGHLDIPQPWLKRHSETLKVITTAIITITTNPIIKLLLYFITSVTY